MIHLFITISGKDEPGLVSKVADRILRYGGNWERSRMINLSGRFVGLLQVSVPNEKRGAIEEAIRAIPGLDLTVAEDTSSPPGEDKRTFQLELMGADHPGIVSEIFGTITEGGLNVESISTRTEAAADSGTMLFYTSAILSCGASTDIEKMGQALENLAQDLFVEIKLIPA